MQERTKITIVTLTSAFLFCAMTVFTSLSPLSQLGKNANQFNSLGMWISLGLIFLFYLIPLVLYLAGLKWMKYVIAVLCWLGLFIFISLMLIFIIFGVSHGIVSSIMPLLIICGMGCITNILWFIAAFQKKAADRTASMEK
nr:DUF5391 family protein [uncultured Bacillus sp.]